MILLLGFKFGSGYRSFGGPSFFKNYSSAALVPVT